MDLYSFYNINATEIGTRIKLQLCSKTISELPFVGFGKIADLHLLICLVCQLKFKIMRLFLTLLLSFLAFTSFQKNYADKKFLLIGVITGVGNGKLFLTYLESDMKTKPVEIEINNDKFQYKYSIDKPKLCELKLEGKTLMFYLEPMNVSIIGTLENFEFADVKGGQLNNDFGELDKQYIQLDKKLQSLFKPFHDAQQNKDQSKLDSISNIVSETHVLRVEIAKDYCLNNPNSIAGLYFLYENFAIGLEPDSLEYIYNKLSNPVQSSFYAQKIKMFLNANKRAQVGSIFKNFILPDTSGHKIYLATFESKNKLLLIDFWASWCYPCRHEHPNLISVFAKYHNKNFNIISISLDDDKQAWINAIKADKLAWAQLSDLKGFKSEVAEYYGIKAIPVNFLIDESGKIIAKNLRGQQVDSTLQNYFK